MNGDKRQPVATPPDAAKSSTSLAHEVNNPLTSLLNLLFLIQQEATLTERGRHCLWLAQEEVRRISQIAGEVLNARRARSLPEVTDVVQLMRGVLDFYKSRFLSHRIVVKTRFCSDGRAKVYDGQVRQMLSNLLLNAADATPDGGTIHARVSTANEWAGRERHGLRISVADNGAGISADNLPKIFEPFFTTKGSEGNGMGLSLVRDIVRRHYGRLRVRSSTEPGSSGTVFSIFLPANADEIPQHVAA